MFNRFTEGARRCLFSSREIAMERRHEAIEPDDLLRAIVKDAGPGHLPPVPWTIGWDEPLESDWRAGETVEDRRVRLWAKDWFRATGQETPFTPEVVRALQAGAGEADALGQNEIRPTHLLIGLMLDEGTGAWRRLTAAGVTLVGLREVARLESGGNDTASPER